jgi:hypothetical protein
MARDGAGGGMALGWLLLGFLAGVAVTLGALIWRSEHQLAKPAVAAVTAPPRALVAAPPPIKPAAKKTVVASAAPPSAAPARHQAAADEVADDAAAAGLTTRITPASPTDAASDTANN